MTQYGLPKLIAHRIRIEARAETPLTLGPQPGQQLRGALFGILRRHYCAAPTDPDPGHSAVCPVCWLLAREDDSWWRGHTPVRPYAIDPPSPSYDEIPQRIHYEPGEILSFGITLFGQAVNLFPYLVVALPPMGQTGLGHRQDALNGRRGRFALQQITEDNTFTGQKEILFSMGEQMVRAPSLAITTEDVIRAAQAMADDVGDELTLRFLTPTRIIRQGQLTHRPLFRPLFGRLVDRIEGLAREYGDASEIDPKPALAAAERVELVRDETRWIDLTSHSTRTGRTTPAGGFIGQATYRSDDWPVLLPWLLWGAITHVGKNAVKGEGWYDFDG